MPTPVARLSYPAGWVGPIQPHLVSVDCRLTSDPAVIVYPTLARCPSDRLPGLDSTDKRSIASWTRPYTAQATTTAAYELTPTTVAWLHSYDLAGLPGLGATEERSVALWAKPCTSLATTKAGYNLPPTPAAWLRSDNAAVVATTNPTALATLFVLADLEALA